MLGVVVTGIEAVAGLAVGYLLRKFRRIGTGVDQEIDRTLDAGLDALHRSVTTALRGDKALDLLQWEAAEGRDNARTERRVTDAIARAAETDPRSASNLRTLVTDIEKADVPDRPGGSTITQYGQQNVANFGNGKNIVSGGNITIGKEVR